MRDCGDGGAVLDIMVRARESRKSRIIGILRWFQKEMHCNYGGEIGIRTHNFSVNDANRRHGCSRVLIEKAGRVVLAD